MSNSATDSFGLDQIGQIAVPVGDIERAITFYRDTLGMRFLFQAPPGLGFFDCAGVRLMLDEPAKAQTRTHGSVIYLQGVRPKRGLSRHCPLAAYASKASPTLSRGCPDHELWMAFFRDPDENLLALMSEIRK